MIDRPTRGLVVAALLTCAATVWGKAPAADAPEIVGVMIDGNPLDKQNDDYVIRSRGPVVVASIAMRNPRIAVRAADRLAGVGGKDEGHRQDRTADVAEA